MLNKDNPYMEKEKATKKSENYKSYGKGELASLYAPNINPASACKRLAAWIAHHPTLLSDLRKTGYCEKLRTFTPLQVRLIFEALGEP